VPPAALFDLDRTLLRIDSGTSYMRFQRMRGDVSRFGMAQVLWWGVQYRLAVLDVEQLATRLALGYAGDPERAMIERCRVWFEAFVQPAIAPAALRALERHRAAGDTVALCTGSTQYIAAVVAGALGIEHTMCTRVEVADGRFTGRLEQICFGRHKLRIAEDWARAHDVDLDASVFYSDSFNDLPMLERVGTPVAVNPDARLRRHARAAGWRIEQWA
jgi:HAD superfamily hydrolase (TIGR01490 family)